MFNSWICSVANWQYPAWWYPAWVMTPTSLLKGSCFGKPLESLEIRWARAAGSLRLRIRGKAGRHKATIAPLPALPALPGDHWFLPEVEMGSVHLHPTSVALRYLVPWLHKRMGWHHQMSPVSCTFGYVWHFPTFGNLIFHLHLLLHLLVWFSNIQHVHALFCSVL